MNICVVNGSPKGKYSITLQSILYLEKKYPEHTFNVIHIGQQIRAFMNNKERYYAPLQAADLIIFAYPVYTFLAPSQLHLFIHELLSDQVDLGGKYVTQLTTSKHFYDMTAHRYIEDNAEDLKMRVIRGLSADMDDLLTTEGQKAVTDFFDHVNYCMAHEIYEVSRPLSKVEYSYGQREIQEIQTKQQKDVVILTDCDVDDQTLAQRIEDFRKQLPYTSRIVNIREYPFSGGCLGCFRCAGDGSCIYKDGFDTFLRTEIQRAEAIVYAGRITEHSMGHIFKCYDDRQFCNGHRTVTEGMPIGYILIGNYENELNLQTVIEARAQVGHNYLAGVAYDSQSQEMMTKRLSYALLKGYVLPRNFYGVGGMKIFRDLIWLMRGIMKADHEFYKAHGIYDFPQRQWPKMLMMQGIGMIMRQPKARQKMGNKMNEGMIAPYKKVIDKIKAE